MMNAVQAQWGTDASCASHNELGRGGARGDAQLAPVPHCAVPPLETLPGKTSVFMCSGQGSQKPGMGCDLFGILEVRAAMTCASDVFQRDLMAACAQASQAELDDTRTAQAVICALSLGIARALEARGIVPRAVIGFSLGQITALALADMVSDEEALRLVSARSQAMGAAADAHPGAMSALLKCDEADAQRLCDECGQDGILAIANYNCPGQIVIAGSVEAVSRAELSWKSEGGRFRRLATSGAFHTPLMEDARRAFEASLATVGFSEPRIPLICNTDAAPMHADEARRRLADHLVRPVRFEQGVRALAAAGAQSFIEVGYGGVLAGLVRRIAPGAACLCVQDMRGFEDALAWASRESEAL